MVKNPKPRLLNDSSIDDCNFCRFISFASERDSYFCSITGEELSFEAPADEIHEIGEICPLPLYKKYNI